MTAPPSPQASWTLPLPPSETHLDTRSVTDSETPSGQATLTLVHTVHLLGAESSGKTQLGQALARRLANHNIPCEHVEEHLRTWVDQHQRTPLAHEQAGIAAAQAQAICDAQRRLSAASAAPVAVLLVDTTPLMTALYSQHYFGDDSGMSAALAFERTAQQRWVMGLDLPWQPDPGQRDGPQHRDAIDAALRHSLNTAGLSYQMIYRQGQSREHAAWLALQAALVRPTPPPAGPRWKAACDCCSDPDCELALFTRLTA